MTTYYPQLLASRILLDSDRTSLSSADNGDVTGHDKSTAIIVACKIGYNAKDTTPSTYKLQWRNVTDGGSFADVASTGECKWSATSGVLADGTSVTTTTRRCDTVADQTWQNGLENLGDNLLPDSGTLDLGSDSYTELQWGVTLVDGHWGDQYEWRLWNNTSGAAVGTCLAQVTTDDAAKTVAPSPVTGVAANVNPTVVHGSLSITPAVLTGVAAKVDPTVVIAGGGLEVAPDPVTAFAAVVAPAVVLGSVAVAPSLVSGVAAKVDPTVILGSLSITPATAAGVAAKVDPAVVLGDVSITPPQSTAVGAVQNPTVHFGSTVASPDPVTAVGLTANPIVLLGSLLISPSPAASVAAIVDPMVVIGAGGVFVEPSPVTAVAASVEPTVILGSISMTPDPATVGGAGGGRMLYPPSFWG